MCHENTTVGIDMLLDMFIEHGMSMGKVILKRKVSTSECALYYICAKQNKNISSTDEKGRDR